MAATIITRLNSLSENLAVQIMLSVFYEQGYDLIMMESQFSPQLVAEHLGVLKRCNIDDVVLFGFTGITEEMLAHWQSSLVSPVRDTKGFASVRHGNKGAIKVLMQRLYGQGYHSISYPGVPHGDVTTGKRRHETCLAFCKAHKLYPVATLSGPAIKQGYENAAKMITPETTALLCATNTPTLGASKYLQGQRIDTLQLANVDNMPLMKLLHPEIITVDPGYAETGRQAACQLIVQVIERNEPRQIIILATLS